MTSRKNLDPNAKAAFEQYKYEIADELGVNNTKKNLKSKGSIKISKVAKKSKK